MERRDFVVINATVSKYDNLFNFHEDMGIVLYNYKYGFIDKEGREIVPTIYDDVKNYSDSYAAVKQDNKWFFINKKGEKVSSDYDFVQSFQNGFALVEKNSKWGIINKNFEEVIPITYERIEYPSDNLVLVSDNGIKKYINLNNEEVIVLPNYIKRAYPFQNGIARLEDASYQTGYIDKNGKNITGFIYKSGSDLEGNLAVVENKEGSTIIYKDGKELFNKTKEFSIIPCKLKNGIFEVSFGYRKHGLINHLGGLVTKKTYSHMYYPSDKLIRVQDENNNYGFIDVNGNEIIPPILDFADDFYEELALVRDSETHKYGYMDKHGILVIPYMYDMARSFSNGMAIVEIKGNKFYIDKNNNPLKVKETKKQIIKVEAPGNIPNFIIDYDITKDFLRYRTELTSGPDWTPRVVETKEMDKALEHEEKVLNMQTEIQKSMEELTNSKILRK